MLDYRPKGEKSPNFLACLAAALLLFSVVRTDDAHAQAVELTHAPADLVTDSLVASIKDWATKPIVIDSILGRNKASGVVPQDQIDALDKQWRAEREMDDQPLITSVLANPLSSYLTRIQARSLGVLSEIFVMDQNGLNAGQSSITSDYWQGDEAKFQKSFGVGAGAVFLDEAELNEDTQTWRAQLNMTIEDASGTPIGAITVELNLTELERRQNVGIGL